MSTHRSPDSDGTPDETPDRGWPALSARASFASHQLLGWIFWDPLAIELYAGLGVPNAMGYYIATRAAPLADAGNGAVVATFYSISPVFIAFSLDTARQHTTFAEAYRVRNQAVGEGLRAYAPEVCEGLAAHGPALWEVVDALPRSGRALFAAHADWPRDEHDPVISAWLALNCIREWRGDTHFALLTAEDISGVQAGLLHDAWMGYPGEWIPRSRGADDAGLAAAIEELTERGLATDGRVNEAGLALRQQIEDRTDVLCERAWRLLGAERTIAVCETIEPAGPALMQRIDDTAGPNWMPAARPRRR